MPQRFSPPLSLLEPFEASARLGSFTKAAKELSVTQSAVSQRVRKLEDMVGTPLFKRQHRSITLTDEGRELLNGVTVALRHLSSSVNGLHRKDVRARVKLGTDTSIAGLWLSRRWSEVLTQERAWDVDLTVSDVEEDLLAADVAIIHGGGAWPGFDATLLFADDIVPVCAPSYLDQFPIAAPPDLLRADLIDLDYVFWNWANWTIWLTEKQLDPVQARIVLRTNSYTAQIETARQGLGVALGWRALLQDDLAAGRLIAPLQDGMASGFGYHLLRRQGSGAHTAQLAQRLSVLAGVSKDNASS